MLSELWNNEIVHRDIKPDNIIISGGKPYIIDFGVAKDLNISSITQTGFQPGSQAYMSPEQILGKNKIIGYKSDFFSLGVLAYYLYHGEYPFGNDLETIIEMFTKGEIKYKVDDSCLLKNFFEGVFNIEPYSRPRNIELLLKLLS